MIVNIRGTSGSGKSTVVTSLMQASKVTPLDDERGRVMGYQLEHPTLGDVYVVGKYETACGGCDGIKTQDEICDRVRLYAPLGHVVFEGLLISHLYSRYAKLADELGDMVFAFLDTPLELCLERVQQRRLARGNTKPLNPKNTTDKWHDMRRVYKKFQDSGHRAYWISHKQPVDAVTGILL